MRHIGVDLHKRQFHVCYYSGGVSGHRAYKMAELGRFISTLEPGDQIAVEATGNTRYFIDRVTGHVSKVVVVNPRQIRVIEDSIKKTDHNDAKLEERGKSLKGYRNITSIKGIGDKSAAILLSVIGDIHNFPSRKQLDSYFGIVPKVRNSGDTRRHGHISKQGSKLGRTTLVQCTLVAIQYSPYLRFYYERLKSQKRKQQGDHYHS